MLKEPKLKIGLKYCGCCNPQIDLTMITAHLVQLVKRHGLTLVPASDSNTDFDILISLSGCPRACAVKKELTSRAVQTISVVGESIGGIVIPEISIPPVIEKELCEGVFMQRVNTNFNCPPQG